MNAAKGEEKTDAMAALLTALVQDRRMMRETMMSHMMKMMGDKARPGAGAQGAPEKKK
jgi:hypothetical protein